MDNVAIQNMVRHQWRMLDQPPAYSTPPRGMDRLWMRVQGRIHRLRRTPGLFLKQADVLLSRGKSCRHFSDRKLRGRLDSLGERYRRGRATPADRDLGLILLREVATRTVGLRPYREQVAGALALNAGCIIEMATGEGKTLTAALAAVLEGWRGRGCHVVTANDYLAERDAANMRGIYDFCGLTVDRIAAQTPWVERRNAYHAHITYCTNKEVAADFLRDRLIMGPNRRLPAILLAKLFGDGAHRMDGLVQRGLESAIVDEADAIFIDEAVTPLRISGEGDNPAQADAHVQAARLAGALNPDTDYCLDANRVATHLTRLGKNRLTTLAKPLGGLWSGVRRREEMVLQAITARTAYQRDVHYVIQNRQVVIIDEFTGRLMADRTWQHGLHQAIEAKEGVPVNLPRDTHASISFQRFFRLYGRLAGMSGTAAEARSEMWDVYGLPVIALPSHRPCQRRILPDRLFTTKAAKWDAVVEEICRLHHAGRPILVGTGSVRESRALSRRLSSRGLHHRLLNAVEHTAEARIVAEAGLQGSITVSTNMAGRGTDIELGPGVAELGGLHVLATQRHAARRIDRQLAGRCARQGDPGSAQAFVSLEDRLVRRTRSSLIATLTHWFEHGRMEISSSILKGLIRVVQRFAEHEALCARKAVLSADDWLERQLGFASRNK